MAKMMLILTMLLTMLTMLTTGSAKSILRTDFGYTMKTLNAQVYFATDNGRIVFYTMPQLITAEKCAQQESEENETFSNLCAQENPETHLDSLFTP